MVGYITCKAIIALNPYTNSVILSRFGILCFLATGKLVFFPILGLRDQLVRMFPKTYSNFLDLRQFI